MFELDLKLTAEQVLEECGRRGLIIRSKRELAARSGSHHWHLGMPGRPGTLELNEWQDRVWVKVHEMRDGGWATALAHELSASRAPGLAQIATDIKDHGTIDDVIEGTREAG